MKLRIAINKIVLEVSPWRPNICLKWPGFQVSTYFCQAFSCEGKVAWWPQRSADFRSGFVLRVLWFGLILRYGKPAQIGYYGILDEDTF